jgi:hypothetical protein
MSVPGLVSFRFTGGTKSEDQKGPNVSIELSYLSAARYDDEIAITTPPGEATATLQPSTMK